MKKKTTPPPPEAADSGRISVDRPSPGARTQVHFDVTPAYKRALRIWAAEREVTLKTIFYEAMELWEAKNGLTPPPEKQG